MAQAGSVPHDAKFSLEIRTKSVEQTLLPLVNQITTLVNHKERPRKSEKTLRALYRVGQEVSSAIARFVSVGEAIARDNPEDIGPQMCVACREAREAGIAIQSLTQVPEAAASGAQEQPSIVEKKAMISCARSLLSAITRVLLLADRVLVRQLVAAKDQVCACLDRIEESAGFSQFVVLFTQFGGQMVELAHLSGDRQNDLKNPEHQARLAVARSVLEKGTMRLLMACKVFLRHPESQFSRDHRDGLFRQMRRALDQIHCIITWGLDYRHDSSCASVSVNGDSGISLSSHFPIAQQSIANLFNLLDRLAAQPDIAQEIENKLCENLDGLLEAVQDFTDSANTRHSSRQKILTLSESLREHSSRLHHASQATGSISLDSEPQGGISETSDMSRSMMAPRSSDDAEISNPDASSVVSIVHSYRTDLEMLNKVLLETSLEHAADAFRSSDEMQLLPALRTAAFNGERSRLEELGQAVVEQSDMLAETCKLLRHVAAREGVRVWLEHYEHFFKMHSKDLMNASHILCVHCTSKIAKENLQGLQESWALLLVELAEVVKELGDAGTSRYRMTYMSLPRPGKHGATSKNTKPVRLSPEEQAKIAKLGLEMKLITSEMEAEAEKWCEPDNAIIHRAKSMSSMAFSMYLFTRSEGQLRTTQDLFTQAHYFADEGTKLYQTVKEFSKTVPICSHRTELITLLEGLPSLCHELNFTIKSPTVGKTATFNKVDSVIQETKNLMNAVAKVVTSCFVCATKFSMDHLKLDGIATEKWSTDFNIACSDSAEIEALTKSTSQLTANLSPDVTW